MKENYLHNKLRETQDELTQLRKKFAVLEDLQNQYLKQISDKVKEVFELIWKNEIKTLLLIKQEEMSNEQNEKIDVYTKKIVKLINLQNDISDKLLVRLNKLERLETPLIVGRPISSFLLAMYERLLKMEKRMEKINDT